MPAHPVEIVGGGLAGLSLGLALQRSGVPTRIVEAGTYPRHKVCGEFIAGLRSPTLHTLGLEPHLADALRHEEVCWYGGDRLLRTQRLSTPALAVSRWVLDARLAAAFQDAGGELLTCTRAADSGKEPGSVIASGRRRGPAETVGLKLHARGLRLRSDLEFHLGHHAYVGLCRVDADTVNICGLFKTRPGLAVTRETALLAYLRASNLDELATRLEESDRDPLSCSAVAGLVFQPPERKPSEVRLGDAFAMIPPYTGNGMAIAFQSAAEALGPLQRWARGETSWAVAVQTIGQNLHSRFGRRLRIATSLHPFLFNPTPQQLFQLASRSGLLPLGTLVRAVHS